MPPVADTLLNRLASDDLDVAHLRRFVAWNTSIRFNDGFEFGFGAEIDISTDRLHARRPMGLNELCPCKYLGTGQVRA